MARFKPRPAHTTAGRRLAETRPRSGADGRSLYVTGRTTQMNLKVRAEFKDHVYALARSEGVMMIEIIERAVEEYIERRGR